MNNINLSNLTINNQNPLKINNIIEKKQLPLESDKHQNNKKDIFIDTWVRNLAFTNEVGTALEPVIKTPGLIASYIPALTYIGADVIDKYKRGEKDDYSQPSGKRALKQLSFQMLASVILPTAIVEAGKGMAAGLIDFAGLLKVPFVDKIKNKELISSKFKTAFEQFEKKHLPNLPKWASIASKVTIKPIDIIKAIAGLATLAVIIKPLDKCVEEIIIPHYIEPIIYGKNAKKVEKTDSKEQ